jgi:putative nucleotidyltransferase with HDIG domain
MKRVLFVDDEPHILEGLRDRLRRQREKWVMTFVGSGQEALAVLRAGPVDVIVTDMRMPQMDGATLLRRIQDDYPGVVRIVLSGHAELETALRAVPVAHQFLTKPCDAGLLENVIERACNLKHLINDEVVRRIVGKIEKLPSLPRVYSTLVGMLAKEDVSLKDVARVVKQDIAMTAKILQIVNSAFFGLSRTVSEIEDAIAYLGFSTVKQVVLAADVFRVAGDHPVVGGLSLDGVQRHSLLAAGVAARFFDDRRMREEAFSAALLHDIGKLLLAAELPSYVQQVVSTMGSEGIPMNEAEERLSGVSHAEVGAYLLGLWGLPYPIVEAVANHHRPERVEQQSFDILAAVHVADVLANEFTGPVVAGDRTVRTTVNHLYLERLGVGGRFEAWHEMAEAQAACLPLEQSPG